jgi:hypothetical protein
MLPQTFHGGCTLSFFGTCIIACLEGYLPLPRGLKTSLRPGNTILA